MAGHALRDLGTRGDEPLRPLPGDDVLPDAQTVSTMAITIAAAPGDVFPWLMQMGWGRAGWYSLDRLDNGGRASAREIVPAWQQLAIGDHVPARPNGAAWFEVTGLERDRSLVLRASLSVPGGRSYAPEQRPRCFSDSTWSFVLERQAADRTRLLVRLRVSGAPRRALGLANALVLAPGHVVMQRRQLANLRRRAEALSAAR